MKIYTFIKPFKMTIGSKDADALSVGAVPFQEINFKIGDKINGTPFGGQDTNKVVSTRIGNAYFNIPPEYLKEEAENQLAVAPKTAQVSNFEYYTSANFLKRASVSIVPVALIGVYSYNKKFSLLKSTLLISIPIVAITGLQYVFMGGGKNSYWGIFVPPSMKTNSIKQIK
jgi:hypothetical protein